ncbi:MAG: shikimate kinase [Prevotellaceae bacterium]|nr:shikimate kinase [Prevotellaceae bacterium]
MNRVFLVGYMGSGKSTVGKLLAERLGWLFIDLDCFIENRYQKTVSQIFDEEGEMVFRKMERQMLFEISKLENAVISTGGGAPCFSDNMQEINRRGTSIYLQLTAENLAARLQAACIDRPLVRNKTKEELPVFIQEMLLKREPFYTKASFTVDNNESNPQAVVDTILNLLPQS